MLSLHTKQIQRERISAAKYSIGGSIGRPNKIFEKNSIWSTKKLTKSLNIKNIKDSKHTELWHS